MCECVSSVKIQFLGVQRAFFLASTQYVCVVDHVLEVYSFDSIALHMDGLNQIPQTQSRVMLNGAEVTLQQLLGEKMARFSDDVYM